MIRWLIVLLALALSACATVPAPVGDKGYVEWEALAAPGLPDQHVSIWIPPQYDGSKPLPVLYMWDGQNLFDPAKTHYGKAWMAQDVVAGMALRGEAEPHIIVGVWSPPGKDRYRVYVPQFAEHATGPLAADIARMAGGPIASKAQLDWVADVLKPRVDRTFRTRKGAADTTIAGASMGGVMACYAAIERPGVFGRAGCVSAHLALADPEIAPTHAADLEALWSDYLDKALKPASGQRLWIDHGTVGLDGYYGPWQAMVARQLEQRGWREGEDFTARVFQQAEHDEIFWNRRMPAMLSWLWRRN